MNLVRGTAHVWWIAEDAIEQLPMTPFDAVLDEAERARAARFVFAADRARFILAHGLLRLVLTAYGCGDAAALRFTLGEWGKPALAGRGPSFNLTHSGAVVMIAVAPECVQIGVDVEHMRGLADADALVDRFFSTAEAACYHALEPSQRQAGFYRLWTRKEAFVKAVGEGLNRSLDSFTVTMDDTKAALLDPPLPSWSLHHLNPAPHHVGALALACPTPRLGGGRLDAFSIASSGSWHATDLNRFV